ncbi:TCB1 transposase, partial [Polyodon spathula]|nr:TCB1 transposase [Polyodon spathula]
MKIKEHSTEVRDKVIQMHRLGKGYKIISKCLDIPVSTVGSIIRKRKLHHTTQALPRKGRPSKLSAQTRRLVREATERPTITLKELQSGVARSGLMVHQSTISRALHNTGLYGRDARKKPGKPLHTKKNMKACLKFAKKHLDDPQVFWNNILWTDESQVELFGQHGHHYFWRKLNTAFHSKNLIPAIKHGGGRAMILRCFAASGPGRLAIIGGTMNSALYQRILQENVRPSVRELKLKRSCVTQQDNDPKHTSKSTSEWLKNKKFKVLGLPTQSPDLNPIENLWNVIKRKMDGHKPSNKAELLEFLRQEWHKVTQHQCERLVESMPRRMKAVLENQGYSTKY